MEGNAPPRIFGGVRGRAEQHVAFGAGAGGMMMNGNHLEDLGMRATLHAPRASPAVPRPHLGLLGPRMSNLVPRAEPSTANSRCNEYSNAPCTAQGTVFDFGKGRGESAGARGGNAPLQLRCMAVRNVQASGRSLKTLYASRATLPRPQTLSEGGRKRRAGQLML
ncbi:hypothetical protein HDZ31DRAFT_70498 [Schizophyllum fasciatum]